MLDKKTLKLFSDPKKRWAWIKYQLTLTNNSIAKVARKNKVKPQTVSSVQHTPYPRMENLLAKEVGVTAQTLFPDRYNEDGLPARAVPARSVYCNGSKVLGNDTSDLAHSNVRSV